MATCSRSFKFMALMAGIFLLSGCSETELATHWAKQVTWPGQQENRGVYKVGNPYKVGSVWYYPEENFSLTETGIASWYGPGFHEDHTANGEIFDQNELTAAHRTLQLPSLVRVTNLENGRSVVVRVNDRGPFMHGRIMDVSKRAAELLGFANRGTARVRIEELEKESRILASAAKRGEDTTRLTLADLQNHDTGTAPAAATPAKAASMPAPVPRATAGVKVAALASDTELPESLRTPTITVEELAKPVAASEPASSGVAAGHAPLPVMAQGHLTAGRFMPDAVVSTAPVSPTGLFVQAGSFSVYANAERLAKRLSGVGRTVIEPVTVRGSKMYRLKLGPIASVQEADGVLEKVIAAGQSTAKVVKK